MIQRGWCSARANANANAAAVCPQAVELSSYVQSHGDLGCRAPQSLHLEEGVNADSSLAADFWSLLGGRGQYRGGSESHLNLVVCGFRRINVSNEMCCLKLCWAVPWYPAILSDTTCYVKLCFYVEFNSLALSWVVVLGRTM